jgi:hypothetical protein
MEEWRPVVGRPEYQVSNFGRVRSDATGGKILKPYLVKGYPAVKFWNSTESRTTGYVHLLVLEAFVGPRPKGMQACHDDGNPFNAMVCNLRWDTVGGNAADRVRHGTSLRGDKNSMTKLTEADVAQIRAELAAGGPKGFQTRISEKWGVSTGYVTMLKQGKVRRYG